MSIETKNYIIECDKEYDYFAYVLVKYIIENYSYDEVYRLSLYPDYLRSRNTTILDETIPYFENHILDDWIHKKAIQKAIESYRVTDEHKKYLKSIK